VASKEERVAIFVGRLAAAPAAATAEAAFAQVGAILNAVEDEFTDIPYDPASWQTDGRLYPPQADNKRSVEGRSGVVRFRSRGHNTYIGENGSIKITSVANDEVVLEKPGRDGRTVSEL
jgi:hypothetical protein